MSTTPPFIQPSLFGDTAGPVRPTDPSTSAEAAALPGRATLRVRVLHALLAYGPQCDERIAHLLGEPPENKPSVGKRRQELVQAGLVKQMELPDGTLMYQRTRKGNRAFMWELTMAGRQAALAVREGEGDA